MRSRWSFVASVLIVLAAPRAPAADATLQAAAQAPAGGTLEVRWTGPGAPGDFVSIDAPGAPDTTYGPYAYPSTGNPLSLRVPEAAGAYLLRYHVANGYAVIATAPLEVTAVTATVHSAPTIALGAALSVAWTGPNNTGDFVSIDKAGSADGTYGPYAYTASGSPLTIAVPEAPGDYVVRYHTGASYRVLATAPVQVLGADASVRAPAEVQAGSVFDVAWTGPGNERDFITLVAPSTAEGIYGASNGYTQRGNPVRMEAPRAPGNYELRYLTGQTYVTLAKTSLRVTPAATPPGRLRVVSEAPGGFGAVEFVLDASGSMLQRIGGERRIDLAKRALVELAEDALPADSKFALRVFGHREADSCRTDLEIPLAALDRGAAVARIQALGAMNLAKTPIGASLLRVRDDLAGVTGPALVVLMTDGEETCGGDPKAAITALRGAGLDVRVTIVGFAVDEVALKETFREWARLGNGGFFDAQSGDELRSAVRAALRPAYEVLANGAVVASGTVNGDALELAPGSYQVRLRGSPPKELGEAVIASDTPRELRYSGETGSATPIQSRSR